MTKDIINFNNIRLTTELDKFKRHNYTIPNTFLDGTFTILDLKENYDMFGAKHKKLADKLVELYNVTIRQSEDGLYKSLLNEYKSFLKNQQTRNPGWAFPAVMKNYRANINPIRALYYDTKDMMHRYNVHNDHHGWLLSLLKDKETHHRILDAILLDRRRVDKILNFYHPLFEAASIQPPIELMHLRVLRNDLLNYANLFTKIYKWQPDE